jgi:HlyD family secretion protein
MTWTRTAVCLAVFALIAGFVATQPPGAEKGKEGKSAPPTFKVEKKPFKVVLSVKGTLAAEETAEVAYRPHVMIPPPPSFGPQVIRTIVEHGARVKQGDVVVQLDSTKIEDVIADLETEIKGLQAGLELAQQELPLLEKSIGAELSSAETSKQRADGELRYFLDVDREQQKMQSEWMVKRSKFWKEYAEEELQQLEKMYKANDLTETTERMILRRQQNAVDMARFFYQAALLEHEHFLKHTVPYREKSLKETQVKQELALAKAQKTLTPTAIQKQTALKKMRYDLQRSTARLEKLTKDRTALTIHAPISGVVYYGKFHKGVWSASAGQESKLVPGGTVMPDDVFLTVVKAAPVVVHLSIEEKDVHWVKPGLEGKAIAPVVPGRKLSARVTRVAPLPGSPGKFDARVTLEAGSADAALMPGMACTVSFVPYSKPEAVAVPSKFIHDDADKHFVEVVGKSGQTERREITPGHDNGEQTEILAGLSVGDLVLTERPAKTAQGPQPTKAEKEKGAIIP